MKVRCGFVSNSSTSSFVCDICSEKYTGWDASAYDEGWDCSICPNNHTFCNSHLNDFGLKHVDVIQPVINGCEHVFDREKMNFCPECGAKSKVKDEDCYMEGTIDSSACPICLLLTYSNSQMVRYLGKTRDVTKEEVFAIIKKKNKRRRKLYDEEYVSYICEKEGITDDELMKEIKNRFGTYDEFVKFLYKR